MLVVLRRVQDDGLRNALVLQNLRKVLSLLALGNGLIKVEK